MDGLSRGNGRVQEHPGSCSEDPNNTAFSSGPRRRRRADATNTGANAVRVGTARRIHQDYTRRTTDRREERGGPFGVGERTGRASDAGGVENISDWDCAPRVETGSTSTDTCRTDASRRAAESWFVTTAPWAQWCATASRIGPAGDGVEDRSDGPVPVSERQAAAAVPTGSSTSAAIRTPAVIWKDREYEYTTEARQCVGETESSNFPRSTDVPAPVLSPPCFPYGQARYVLGLSPVKTAPTAWSSRRGPAPGRGRRKRDSWR